MKAAIFTALKFAVAVVVGWIAAAVIFAVTLFMVIHQRLPRYNGYLKGRTK
jgi:energy-coupling factor transporter transmembrane protein EcfT